MNNKLSQSIFTIIAIALAALFVGLTLKQTNFETLKAAAQEANYFWFLVVMTLSIVSYWFRAARWQLLSEPIGYPLKVKNGFWAISFAYFMNLTIPRSGEIARATSMYKLEKIPVDKSLGIIVLERVIDLLFLGLFFLLTFLFNAKTLFTFLEMGNRPSLDKLVYSISVFILVLIFLYLLRKPIQKLPFYKKIISFLLGIWTGIKSIMHLQKRGKFILYSFAIWICYFLMTYLVVFAFPATQHFGLGEGFFLLIAGAFGMILPAVGGLGYPYVMSMAFAAIYISNGLTAEEGKTVGNYFGLMLYFSQVITIIIFGILSILYISKNKN